jgi:predicted dehydrogenase
MKIGVVGYGSIGQRHAANATKLAHEVIVYDPMLQHNDVKYEREIYDQADAVVIATPSDCHEAGLRACIERGKHVLVEKPISVSRGQLSTLLDTAMAKDLVVMMGNNLRFHPCVKEARNWLNATMIGTVLWAQFTCATWSVKPLYLSDGVILNTGAHEVDLALHLLGDAVVETAIGDAAVADFTITHESGARSSFHLDFMTPHPVRDFRIIGTEGAIQCDLVKRRVTRTQWDPELPEVVNTHHYASPTHSFDDDYIDEMTAFITRAEGGYSLFGADGLDGLATLDLLLDIRKKAGL